MLLASVLGLVLIVLTPFAYASGGAGPARWVTFITHGSRVCYTSLFVVPKSSSCARTVTLLDQPTRITIHTRNFVGVTLVSETGYVLQIDGEPTFTLGLGPSSVLSVPKQNYTIQVYVESEPFKNW